MKEKKWNCRGDQKKKKKWTLIEDQWFDNYSDRKPFNTEKRYV